MLKVLYTDVTLKALSEVHATVISAVWRYSRVTYSQGIHDRQQSPEVPCSLSKDYNRSLVTVPLQCIWVLPTSVVRHAEHVLKCG